MQNLTLRQKIGQLFLIGFAGDSLSATHPLIADIEEENLGGVILFDRFIAENKACHNITCAEQVEKLTTDLQEVAKGRLLIAVDQEGGKVNRFKAERGFPTTPTAAELGRSENTEATATSGRQTARLLKRLGINFNLAPVVDLDSNKDNPIIGRYGRSFSNDGHSIAAHAKAWIEAHRAEGILCCLKHFPGHGSSTEDSHQGFVDITTSWHERELLPYELLINSGHAEAIMVGHLVNRNLDALYPATLSPATLQTLLRRKLGFNGLRVSDDMQMKAITAHYGLEDACCRALGAGIDLLIIGNNLMHDPGILVKVKDAIMKSVHQGEISEQRITEACASVEKFKLGLQGPGEERVVEPGAFVGVLGN